MSQPNPTYHLQFEFAGVIHLLEGSPLALYRAACLMHRDVVMLEDGVDMGRDAFMEAVHRQVQEQQVEFQPNGLMDRIQN